jgi:hypothetical protein
MDKQEWMEEFQRGIEAGRLIGTDQGLSLERIRTPEDFNLPILLSSKLPDGSANTNGYWYGRLAAFYDSRREEL